MTKSTQCSVAALAALLLVQSAEAAARVRKNVKDLTAVEQQTFVDAMLALRNPANFQPGGGWPADTNLPQNRYEQLVRAHDTNFDLAHDNPFFLPWHRQFLFQMENDVRSLGGQFADFTIPYWDGTQDIYPKDKKGPNAGDPPVANGLLGGDGVAGDANRVATGPFANPTNLATLWQAYGLTGTGTGADPFVGTRSPLKRRFEAMTGGKFDYLTANGPGTLTAALAMDGVTVADPGATPPVPGQTFLEFRRKIEHGAGLHDDHHARVGGFDLPGGVYTPIGQLANPTAGTSDPTFWMLHAFTDLNWASWECLRGPLYVGGTGTGLNDAMSDVGTTGTFGLTQLNGGTDVTPANVMNFLTMPVGGYTYQYGGAILGADGSCKLVPEPTTMRLLGIGLALLTLQRRERATSRRRLP
jgi:tyrosinase